MWSPLDRTEAGRPLLQIPPETLRRSSGFPAIALRQLRLAALVGLMLFVCFIYVLSNPQPGNQFDYQFRIARALLSGKLGLDQPVSWLNELVPFEGRYYSVFPLGSVLCMVPIALLQHWRGAYEFPAREVIAWIAGSTAVFVVLLTRRYADPLPRRLMLTFLLLFGSWTWCNLVSGTAWQLALALAMLGQFGALAFTLIARHPFLAGIFFAIAFGNRTEVLLTTPVVLYLLLREDPYRTGTGTSMEVPPRRRLPANIKTIALFLVVPVLLVVATLAYNQARFHDPLDFGYARIPGLLNEPWYRHGFFSPYAIPLNMNFMMWASSWNIMADWPYLAPRPYGGSIVSSCPYLLLLMREGGRDRSLRIACWIAITLLTVALWLHGNPGGWQFSYRYATVLLPWLFLILLDQRGGKVQPIEGALFALSMIANIWAVYIFCWTTVVN